LGYDLKYGKVTTEHGDIPDDEPVIVFRARDVTALELLTAARYMALGSGSPQRHLDLFDAVHRQFEAWQEAHPDKVRVPDSERSRAWLPQLKAAVPMRSLRTRHQLECFFE
jgi:hypothetical protein